MKQRSICIIVLTVWLCLALYGCGGYNHLNYVYDFYGENRLELPIPMTHVYGNGGGFFYFDSVYTPLHMCSMLEDAGYKAELIAKPRECIFLSVPQETGHSYYVIYQTEHSEYPDLGRYLVEDAGCTYRVPKTDRGMYHFLAPVHVMEKRNEVEGCWQVYASFDDIAFFYENSGKSDIKIDLENQTIYFPCKENQMHGYLSGTIALSYFEIETDSFLKLTPVS